MKTALHILAILVGAFLTVALSELLFIVWMTVASFDITASPILRGSMWAQLIVTGIGITLLAPLLRQNKPLYPGLYFGLALGLYLLFLFGTFNPPVFAFQYVLPMVGGFVLWTWLNTRMDRL